MTNSVKYLVPLLFAMGLVSTATAQYGYPSPPPQYGVRTYAPPPEVFERFERQGYFDGVQGAQRDFQNRRIWNVNNRDEFRNPRVPGEMRHEYREGFERGYYATVRRYEGFGGR